MTKVRVKNQSDRVVERLGYYFQPKQEIEIELKHPRHRSLLYACRYLDVEEVEEPKKVKKTKK